MFGLGDWVAERHRDEWLEGMAPSWRGAARGSTPACGWPARSCSPPTPRSRPCSAAPPTTARSRCGRWRRCCRCCPRAWRSARSPTPTSAGEDARPRCPTSTRSPSGSARVDEPAAAGDAAAGLPRAAASASSGVSFAYPGGEPVLRELDLELPGGQLARPGRRQRRRQDDAVTLLARMREPTGGRDHGRRRAAGPSSRAREWQRQVAVVYQDFTRFPLSAAENVGMFGDGRPTGAARAGRRARRRRRDHRRAARAAGTRSSRPQYAGGVDLSGGQWQRIALARALYAVETGARVLVLDEPTAQLDVRGEAAFYDRFLELTAGVTSIVISHRFASVRRADRIAVLDGGADRRARHPRRAARRRRHLRGDVPRSRPSGSAGSHGAAPA